MKEVELVTKTAEKAPGFLKKHKKGVIVAAVATGVATVVGVAASVLKKEPEYYECGTSEVSNDSPAEIAEE